MSKRPSHASSSNVKRVKSEPNDESKEPSSSSSSQPITAPRPNDPIVLSVFADKGGVVKTTTSATFAWQLAELGHRVVLYDCDAQRSLTAMLFTAQMKTWSEKNENKLYTDWVHREFTTEELRAQPPGVTRLNECDRTLFDQMASCVKTTATGVNVTSAAALKIRDNLYVVPGDRRIGEFDSRITVGESLLGLSPDQAHGNSHWTGMPYACILETGRQYGAKYVVLDLNPSSGVLNRCLVACSHFILAPVIADFFSFDMLSDMQKLLDDWSSELEEKRSKIVRIIQCRIPPPSHKPKYLGYVLSRYVARKVGQVNPTTGVAEDVLTKSEEYCVNRIDQASEALCLYLESRGMAVSREQLTRVGYGSTCRGMIRNFAGLGVHLVNMAQAR